MTPIENWEKYRIDEVNAGNVPTCCIMGSNDYASLCGALGMFYGILPFGAKGHFVFQGITVMASRSSQNGIMFA